MRLLEFNRDEGGANPQQAARIPVKRPRAAARTRKPVPKQAAAKPSAPLPPPLFAIKGNSPRTPARRPLIDIVSLQRRIEVLERRMQERASREGSSVPIKELEQLKQRMQLLERNLSNELWSAKQRESAMLEILARQPLEARLKQRAIRLYTHDLPVLGRWLYSCGRQWWEDNHPGWWPQFFQAWQESLDKARGISRT